MNSASSTPKIWMMKMPFPRAAKAYLTANPVAIYFTQVKSIPPLADRVAAVLAPYLQTSTALAGSKACRTPKLTAAAAAVNASSYAVMRRKGDRVDIGTNMAGDSGASVNANDVGVKTSVNGNTSLAKDVILEALWAVGVGVKAPPSKKKGTKGGAGTRRKKDPLAAGVLAAMEVCQFRA